MSPDARYRLNGPTVACQVIEGEAIIIHFEKGTYYSSDAVGALIIQLIQDQIPVEEIIRRIEARSTGDQEAIRSSVSGFVEELRQEDLISPVDPAPAVTSAPYDVARRGEEPFVAPLLKRFDDLQDILVLDPIHDGDQPAWPVADGAGGDRSLD
jgi:hypothetical protein